jgi:hypothetical protein
MADLREAERGRGAKRIEVRLELEDLAALVAIRDDLERRGEPATDTDVVRAALGRACAALKV